MKNLKTRLITMNFLQFFIWGAWLISLGRYCGKVMHFDGLEIGNLFGTMGIASIFMPGLMGIVADKWLNAEKLLALLHFFGALALVFVASIAPTSDGSNYWLFYGGILMISIFYMPTISLTNAIAYSTLERAKYDIVKTFPPIRVWGTVGFILAMWSVNISGAMDSNLQLYISATASVVLAMYSLTLPKCPPVGKGKKQKNSLLSSLGLDAFILFKDKKMAVFFIFSMLLGAALQVTNTYGNIFLDSFNSLFPDSFAVKYPNILLSLSQVSETLFILAIPFFLSKYGIKRVMIMSMLAWVLRFGFFGIGDPGMPGVIFLVLSMIVYGMAFDFFNISGSMFVEKEANPSMRASAQGLFMIMTNGLGAIIGGFASGSVVKLLTDAEGITNWSAAWFIFAGYALTISILFAFLFNYREQSEPKKQ